MGRLDEGVDPLLRLQAGVGGPAARPPRRTCRRPCGRPSGRRRPPPARARARAPHAAARSSMSWRDVSEPTSSSHVNSSSTPARSASEATAWMARDDAALHVEHPGSGRPPVTHRERPRRQCAEREHRVVMADDEHPGAVAAPPVDVRAGGTRDQLRRRPEALLGSASASTFAGLPSRPPTSCDGDSTLTRRPRSADHHVDVECGDTHAATVATVSARRHATVDRPAHRRCATAAGRR